jgi:hypothetical protein
VTAFARWGIVVNDSLQGFDVPQPLAGQRRDALPLQGLLTASKELPSAAISRIRLTMAILSESSLRALRSCVSLVVMKNLIRLRLYHPGYASARLKEEG